MDIVAIIIIMSIAVISILVFYTIGVYNKLIDAKNKVEDQFTQIDIELKKKTDTLPKLVEITKEYAKHEDKTLNEGTNARNKVINSSSINEKIKATNSLNKALNKIFELSETYSELKSNTKFKSIQKDLKLSEDKINYAKSFYNDAVLNYNNLREQFPSNVVANIFKIKEIDYFK